ncbi:putative CCR4-associated factor [Abeliophyllum distichum]|uniref:poly(A)-specific ribonuclease n=1 Tax=Abeliophyllum distichum TaxID=126358 RepID=A0ABD1UL97_9LAMI
MARPIKVHRVWQCNLEFEFNLIHQVLGCFPYVYMDTEFLGVVFHHPEFHYSSLSPSQNYLIMKKNVDALKIIQFGLTLADAYGDLLDFGTQNCYVWEFNFNDFDVDKDLQNPDSIALLKRQGIDFSKNKKIGISSYRFATLFMASGLSIV